MVRGRMGSVDITGIILAGVAIIPHTYQNTIVRTYQPRQMINVEVDLIGKYVEKFISSLVP